MILSRQNTHNRTWFSLIACVLPSACAVRSPAASFGNTPVGQTQSASVEERIDGDRPHVGTGTHLVAPGDVQFELGGQFNSFGSRKTYASPILGRVGLTDSIEGRVEFDGLIGSRERQRSVSSIGNVQLGAKVRVWGARDEPWLSIMPSVTLGLASSEKGLGSGDTDLSMTLMAGRAIGNRWHAEANYGVAAVGGGDERRHFGQHLMTGAAIYSLTSQLAGYGEVAFWSRQEIDGRAVTFTDFGLIYGVNPRLVLDAGGAVGLSAAAPTYLLFAGLSFLIEPARSPHQLRKGTRLTQPHFASGGR